MQPSDLREYQDEDCLFVNVWAPPQAVCDAIPGGCPVWVHIHGGGWVGGSGSDGMYWGPFAANVSSASSQGSPAAPEPVISVTFNYRLGAFGFMATNRDGTWYSNYGFEDQRMALEWVQTNIGRFGGDAAKVTLTGQSAGGISVLTHLTSPKSYGLFQRVVVQSGPAMTLYRSVDQSTDYTMQLAKQVGCDQALLHCLQQVPAEDVLAAQLNVRGNPILVPPPIHADDFAPWMIVIDGENVINTPMALLRRGEFAPITAAVIGNTANETAGWLEAFPVPVGPVSYGVLTSKLFGNLSDSIMAQYPLERSLPSSKNNYVVARLLDDYTFTCANRELLNVLQTAPRSNVPLVAGYVFTHQPSAYPRNTGTVSHCSCAGCSCHGAEMTFIKSSAAFANASFTSKEVGLATNMMGAFTSYVSDGFGSNAFPLYSAKSDNILMMGADYFDEVTDYHKSLCDFWSSTGLYIVPA